MKRIFITLTLIGITAAYTANLYTPKIKINYPEVEAYLSADCANIVNMSDLRIFEEQINRMRTGIPRIKFFQSNESLTFGLQNHINKSIALTNTSTQTGKQQIFIAYKPGETYGLGNVVGKVFATNSGLILLNDQRINQAYGYDKGFVANLIIHEVLHVYGLDHADGLGNLVKNKPVMSLGKQSPIGMSFDDEVGLLENYEIPVMRRFSTQATGTTAALIKGKQSQAKNIKNGTVIFTHVPKNNYWLVVDGKRIRRVKVK